MFKDLVLNLIVNVIEWYRKLSIKLSYVLYVNVRVLVEKEWDFEFWEGDIWIVW